MEPTDLQPWEHIAWSPERTCKLYRDWALAYTRRNPGKAQHYFDKALELKSDDPNILYFRSKVKRSNAQAEGAYEDSTAALKFDSTNVRINLEICDDLYDMNILEHCKVELHDNSRRFIGNKVKQFYKRLDVINENFKDSLGESLGPFILKNEKHFDAVVENIRLKNNPDLRILWKKLQEQDKCDVLSIPEKDEIILSPREIARRQRALKVYYQTYLNTSWKDVIFIKDLCENPQMVQPESMGSTPVLRQLTREQYGVVKKFVKNIQARSPMYNELLRRCPDRKACERQSDANLYRIQYQTRRNMMVMLRNVRELRKDGKVQKLSRYIEGIMGDYVVLKTHRVMPWKFEFVTEIYNLLALAHADRYVLPNKFKATRENNTLMEVLRMPTDRSKDPVPFVFGDRSTYQEPDKVDPAFIAYKKFLTRLDLRLRFAKYCIEKCYILHEIARSHLAQSRFDECCLAARKAVEEAKQCGSSIWEFLSTMLILKSDATQRRTERIKESLDTAMNITERLKSPDLSAFIQKCSEINDRDILIKKKNQSSEFMFRKKSKQSMSAHSSPAHSYSSSMRDQTSVVDQNGFGNSS